MGTRIRETTTRGQVYLQVVEDRSPPEYPIRTVKVLKSLGRRCPEAYVLAYKWLSTYQGLLNCLENGISDPKLLLCHFSFLGIEVIESEIEKYDSSHSS